jgi:hypothetical protein
VPVFETNKQVYVAAPSKPEVPVFETDKLAPGYIKLWLLFLEVPLSVLGTMLPPSAVGDEVSIFHAG